MDESNAPQKQVTRRLSATRILSVLIAIAVGCLMGVIATLLFSALVTLR